ncbi:MAG: segregation/condensation protein A [Nanoarchaeota archaeon]
MGDEEDYNFDVVKEVRKDGEKSVNRVGQEEIQGLLFGEQLSWQAIIYDLINTDQLDPWDIDLVLLTSKYLEKIRAFEEANLFVSSKVLFAAALLLRIKSEILLNKYIPSLDIILFGQKEEKKYKQERIELDEEIPELIPKTPLARFKKVTLEELMSALGKAVATENRRIEKVVLQRQQEMETSISLPKMRINIKDKLKEVYDKLKSILKFKREKISFSDFSGKSSEDKISTFVPLLHLDYQHKVLLEQEGHLQEIWIWLKELHDEENKEELERMRREVVEFMEIEGAQMEKEAKLDREEELEELKEEES